MKSSKYEFRWFEKEDGRKAFRASVGRDGKLRLGKNLRRVLPPDIRVGFDAKAKILAIADGHGAGIDHPRCGVLTAQALSAEIAATGLRFPLSFRLVRDESTGYFLGRVIPRRHRVEGSSERQYDAGQLLILYRHVVDGAVSQMAKSTPLAERRSCAMEAFYNAVREYCPAYGDLEVYLEDFIRNKLLEENRQYMVLFRQPSLDQPLAGEEDNSFCLYDTLEASSSGGIDQLEEWIMAEQFADSLSERERRLLRLLREGCRIGQIAEELGTTAEEVVEMGRAIGEKRRKFYVED